MSDGFGGDGFGGGNQNAPSAVTLVIEDGSGLPNSFVAGANSLVTLADIRQEAFNLGDATVGGLTDTQLAQAAIRAMRRLNAFECQLGGARSFAAQPLAYPRTGYLFACSCPEPYFSFAAWAEGPSGGYFEKTTPELAKQAQMAFVMGEVAVIADPVTTISRIRQKVGPLEKETEYSPSYTSGQARYSAAMALLGQLMRSGPVVGFSGAG